jgi:hypothetical protein
MTSRSAALYLVALLFILGSLVGLAIGYFFFVSEGDPDAALWHPRAAVGIPFLAGSGAILLFAVTWLVGGRNRYLQVAAVIAVALVFELAAYLSFFN